MEEPLLLSASQISIWIDCERKWGFKYLDGDKPPPHPGAVIGKDVHENQLGPWYLTGREFNYTRIVHGVNTGEVACNMRPLLPPRSPAIQIERRFIIPSPTGKFGYLGYIDLYAPDSVVVPGLVAQPAPAPLVMDFKTTGNLDWAKTKESLRTDVQAQIYAMDVMYEENVDEVDLVWVTGRTRKPHRAQQAHLRATASDVVEQFQRIDAIGEVVGATKLARPKVEDLKPNARMCDSYGGCPYRHKCNLSPTVHASAVNQEAISMSADFLSNLRKNVQGPPAAAAPVAAPAAPAPPPVVMEHANNAYQPNRIDMPPAELPAWATAKVDPLHERRAVVVPINPPESALPPAPPVGIAAPPAPAAEKRTRGPNKPKPELEITADAVAPGVPLDAVAGLAALMQVHQIKRLRFYGESISEIEVA